MDELKRDNVLERLNKRNKDRQNYNDAKSEQRNKENLDLEGADYFSQSFTDRVKEIEKTLSATQGGNKTELVQTFAGINADIQELQRYLTSSTIFLSDYKIKACQNILNELTVSNEEARQQLLPKKKFGFNSKKIPAKVNNPKSISGLDKVDGNEKSTLSPSCFTWTLANRKSEHLILMGDEVDGKDVTISNLSDCLVEIQGHPGSVQVSGTDNCTLLCGPIARSFFAENCKNSTIVAACQQLRFHSSANCKLWLHVTCRAIIEDCTKIEIGDYTYSYSGIDIDFKKAGLDRTQNNYKDVADFNWLSPDMPSPNWKLVNDADLIHNQHWDLLRAKFKDVTKL